MSVSRFVVLLVLVVAVACSGTTPSAPTPPVTPSAPTPAAPTPPVNKAPVITSLTVTSFGISGLTPITMSAAATDEENDAIAFVWSYGASTFTGPATTTTLTGDGAITVRLVVTDSKGASTSDTRTVTIATMTGRWNWVPTAGSACGPFGILTPPVLTLTQNGRVVTGRIDSPGAWCNVPGGTSGTTDPGAPGDIDGDGNFKVRIKLNPFTDTFMTAKMDGTTGRELTGNATFQGSSSGVFPFWLRKL